MSILAFMQNAYTSSQAQAAENERKLAIDKYRRRHQAILQQAIATHHRNYTYQRLRNSFGSDLCSVIWWENASPRWGWKSSDCFPADHEWIEKLIEEQKPEAVLTFGKIASNALQESVRLYGHRFELITGPHPAARHAQVMEELKGMAERVRPYYLKLVQQSAPTVDWSQCPLCLKWGEGFSEAHVTCTSTPIWVVYERPADYPQGYVVRLWALQLTGDCQFRTATFHDTLESARAGIPPGKEEISRDALNPDPAILECWVVL